MSIKRVSTTDNQPNLLNRVAFATAAGAVGGGVYTATRKNWIHKGLPSDTFVRDVSRNLRKGLNSDELKESAKINKFLGDVVDPEINVQTLKPQIRDSKELSEAIKANPAEDLEQAIERVFSQPQDKIKQDLLDLQYKTKIDKVASRNTALKLVNDNFDASARKLSKNPNTSENLFEMIKTTAKKIQTKTIITGATLAGIAVGAMALILSEIPEKKS